jgi:hypothetical protein
MRTVPEAKGKQFDAVLVVIPPDRAPANHTAEPSQLGKTGLSLRQSVSCMLP